MTGTSHKHFCLVGGEALQILEVGSGGGGRNANEGASNVDNPRRIAQDTAAVFLQHLGHILVLR